MKTILLAIPLFPIASVVSAFQMSNISGQVIVIVLFLGSIFAWSIMVTKFIELKTALEESNRFISAYKRENYPMALFIKCQKYSASPLYNLYQTVCSNIGKLVNAGAANTTELMLEDIDAMKHPLKEYQVRSTRNMADQTLSELTVELEKHMVILATAATAAPFLGLLGTVWGVMDAYGGLAMSGSATLSAIAPGVSGALLTTVIGLLVALPSIIGYNILTGRIREISVMMERFAQELMADIERCFLRE